MNEQVPGATDCADYIHSRWHHLSERSPQPLLALEGRRHIVRYANPAFAQLADRPIEEMIGRPFADAVPEGGGNDCLELLDRVYATGAPGMLGDQPHGARSYWSYAAWAMPGENDMPAGVLLQVTDTTQATHFRKTSVAMNEALMISAAKLHELAEMQASLQARDRFIAVLSHEIRNPLNALSTGIRILKVAGDDKEAAESCVDIMERQVKQMGRLVDDLLDISRIATGKLEVSREVVDVGSIVRDAVDAGRGILERGDHKLSIDLPSGPMLVSADPARLTQVLLNLLSNAAKFSEPGGPIELAARPSGDEILISIRDQGIGIPADRLPRIFELFEQVDAEWKRSKGGLGIGLALVRKFVELHDGRVEAHSEGPGKGSEFIVRLPAAEAGDTQDAPARSGAHATVRGRRVLVVEDNLDAARSLSALLQIMRHEVRVAHDGNEGLAVAAAFRPEVILMDLGMPVMDGYETARRIRAQAWGKQPLIIALTGWGNAEDRLRTREAGFDEHLVKPVDVDDLMAMLAEHAPEPRSAR